MVSSFAEDAIFPEESIGSRGGPGYFSDVVRTWSGREEITQRRLCPRHVYNLTLGTQHIRDVWEVRNFLESLEGADTGFRFLDKHDCTSLPLDSAALADTDDVYAAQLSSYGRGDQFLGIGDGSTTEFQLVKRYADAVSVVTRVIEKPIDGTVVCEVNGAVSTEGAGHTTDHATGVVTFSVAPSDRAMIYAGFRFHVPVRVGEATDALWSSYARGWQVGDGDQIQLEEIPPSRFVEENRPRGGARLATGFATGTTDALDHVWSITPQKNGWNLRMPPITDRTPLGRRLIVHNTHSTFVVRLRDPETTSILAALVGGGVREVFVVPDSSGAKVYKFGAA
ncbi:MAG: DUF2460 domain-containing protein [Planctomycetota bacterium JB042]